MRFSVAGRQVELGTGETDRDRAGAVAAELYADAVRGARRVPRRAPTRGQPLAEVAGQWLSEASDLDPKTRGTYALYAETHWCAHWASVEAVTSGSAADYARSRLRRVQAATVRKELSALRKLLAWCVDTGRLAEAPALPSVPKRAMGTRHKQARRGPVVELTPAEARALLAALPVSGRKGYPVRARFRLLYETGLRSETINRLSVPEHWRPGAQELHIPAALDKVRAGRPVPLTAAAARALASAAPKRGLVFPPADLRETLRAAAVAALGPERGERFTERYLRHNRITHWAEESDNLAGIMYLAGHSNPQTTARYAKPSLRAALAVLGTNKGRRR